MKLTKLIRLSEWWQYKMAPLAAMGYATALYCDADVLALLPGLLMVVVSAMFGAAYVSVLNDFTDIDEDLAAGKYNRQSKLTPVQRRLLLAASAIPGFLFLFFFYGDSLPTLFYFLSGVSFTAYSMPPMRLKNKGVWGVVADASGAHLFPTLTIAAAIFHFAGKNTDAVWMISAAVWAFAYGLRGILWHQFSDRMNDTESGTSTYAVKREIYNFWIIAKGILAVEVLALCVLLAYLNMPLLWLVFGLYIIGVAIARTFFNIKVIAILPVPGRNYIFLNTFYQLFWPVAVLLVVALQQPGTWWLLLLHLVLFPQNILSCFQLSRRFFGRLSAQ